MSNTKDINIKDVISIAKFRNKNINKNKIVSAMNMHLLCIKIKRENQEKPI